MARAKRVEATVTQETRSEKVGELAESDAGRLYGVAMLKMALELKKPGAASLEAVMSAVLSRMQLDEKRFRQYLVQNGGLLKVIAERGA